MTGGGHEVATERAGEVDAPGLAPLAELRAIQAAKVRRDSWERLLPVFGRTKGMKRIDRLLAISRSCPYVHPGDRAVWSEVIDAMEAEGL